MKPLLTKSEAAKYLGVSERSFDRLRQDQGLQYIQYTSGGRLYFRQEDLDALIAGAVQKPAELRHKPTNTQPQRKPRAQRHSQSQEEMLDWLGGLRSESGGKS